MASFPPKKNAAYSFQVALRDQADANKFKSNPTLAAGDVKVSKDGGAPANIATLPTAISSGAMLTVSLSATEMNADVVAVLFQDAAGAQWADQLVVIHTAARQMADVATEAKQDTAETKIDTVTANLQTVDDNVDDVKAKTDSLTFTAGAVQADATKIAGDGGAATKAAAAYGGVVTGEAVAGTLSTTQMSTNLTETTNDHYNDARIVWTSGVLAGQRADVTDYDGSSKVLTFTAVTEAPSNGDTFVLV